VLIGEPGVGKTASSRDSRSGCSRRSPRAAPREAVVELLVTSLVADPVRGQFEERVKQLLDEIPPQDNLILFIDELHTSSAPRDRGEGVWTSPTPSSDAGRGELHLIARLRSTSTEARREGRRARACFQPC